MEENLKRQLLENAVSKNLCIAGVVRDLGYSPQRTAYTTIRKEIARMGISTSHWLSLGTPKQNNFKATPKPLSELLQKGTRPNFLKEKLIKAKLLDYKCNKCGLTDWMESPITLQLDHINGDNTDNRLENLRLLCPNCHTQTPTWGAKGRHVTIWTCADCQTPIWETSARCRKCAGKAANPTKIAWPQIEELTKLVELYGYSGTGRRLGVSYAAVKKRIHKTPSHTP